MRKPHEIAQTIAEIIETSDSEPLAYDDDFIELTDLVGLERGIELINQYLAKTNQISLTIQ